MGPGSGMGRMFGMGLGAESIYSFVVIFCSLMIYFGTKELYELSGHKGIKYFRQAFLFFAIAYFSRSFIKFLMSYFNIGAIMEMPLFFGPLTLLIFLYFNTIAVFYLVQSLMWKKWGNGTGKIILFHILALIISLVNIFYLSSLIYLWSHILLLVFILISTLASSEKIKNHKFYYIYILLFVFWLLNSIDLLIPVYLQNFQILIYLFSTAIFLTILYKVTKILGSN
jgi:hypothetical protein